MLLVEVLALGSIKDVDTLLIELLNLTAYNLHCTVHHTVLLGESLRKNSKAAWQPTLWEHSGVLTTLLEHIHIGLYKVTSSLTALLGREVETLSLKSALDIILVRNEQCNGIRRLVVVEDNLVDCGTKAHECLLNALGAVLLTVT